ncbi:unnamed protein product, partial [Mesorhabditis spiculigera]
MLIVFLCFWQFADSWFLNRPEPNRWTEGGVWPLPWKITYHDKNYAIKQGFFKKVSTDCDIIQKALERAEKLAFRGFEINGTSIDNDSEELKTLKIDILSGECPTGAPQIDMDESYSISIPAVSSTARIEATQVWGVLRALESFTQLIFQVTVGSLQIRSVDIRDHPRFSWRGILLDSSRHFLPIEIILENLDIMAQNKMNVFHWHLVDSEAFPYPSEKFPNLTAQGAYSPRHHYTVDNIKKVIDYARLRGIRVLAEFDTPAHTGSWAGGKPGLLAECSDRNSPSSLIDPTLSQNYQFLEEFFQEALNLFPDEYMHFGGDEVAQDITDCWQNNKALRKRMQRQGFGGDTKKLLKYYWKRFFESIEKARPGTKKVVWQEAAEAEGQLSKDTLVHVWDGTTIDLAKKSLSQLTRRGYKVIFSSCWYLNRIRYGPDWGYLNGKNFNFRGMFYECDPQNFYGTQEQKDRVLGGEAAMWGEFVDGTNLIPTLWPRASAVAERLWSNPEDTKTPEAVWPRLHEHRCRMVRRGYRAQPINWPDYCPYEWKETYEEL